MLSLGSLGLDASHVAVIDHVKKALGDLHRWMYNDYGTMPIAEVSTPYVADVKKVPQWELGRTLYDNNDRDLVRRR